MILLKMERMEKETKLSEFWYVPLFDHDQNILFSHSYDYIFQNILHNLHFECQARRDQIRKNWGERVIDILYISYNLQLPSVENQSLT